MAVPVVQVVKAGINYLIELIAAGGRQSEAQELGWPVALLSIKLMGHLVNPSLLPGAPGGDAEQVSGRLCTEKSPKGAWPGFLELPGSEYVQPCVPVCKAKPLEEGAGS